MMTASGSCYCSDRARWASPGRVRAEDSVMIASGGPAPRLTVLNSVPGPDSAALPVGRRELQRQAWQWALARKASGGVLLTGREIARQHTRHERWADSSGARA